MEEKRCKECMYGACVFAMNDVICKYKGLVDKNDICSKFQPNLFDDPRPKKRSPKEYKKEQFKL